MDMDRRRFVSRIIPACAAVCVGSPGSKAYGYIDHDIQEIHKFEKKHDKKYSFLQLFQMNNRAMVRFARTVERKYGKDAMLDLVKECARDRILPGWKKRVFKFPDRSLKTLKNYLYPDQINKTSHTIEVIKDTNEIFEIKVTECLYAAGFKKLEAVDIGYATECWAYYMLVEEYNPSIKLNRDKSMMNGDEYCHYSYILKK